MDHSRLHKASLRKQKAEINTEKKIKRRSLAQRERRNDLLSKQRDLPTVKEDKPKKSRREQLEMWQKERDIHKRQQEKKKKPIFKVSSLTRYDHPLSTIGSRADAGPARNTRSKTGVIKEAAISRAVNQKRKKKIVKSAKVGAVKQEDKENVLPSHPAEMKEQQPSEKHRALQHLKAEVVEEKASASASLKESFAPPDFTFKPPAGLKGFQMSATIPDSNESFVAQGGMMNFVSSTPCVHALSVKNKPLPAPMVLSSESCPSSEEPENEERDLNKANAACKEPGESVSKAALLGEKVEYFRSLITTETEGLNESCTKWEQIHENSVEALTEDVVGEIRSVIGQAQLLMAERFVQFRGLIDKYEHPKPDHNPVTPTDLKGFWEMIYFQVEDVIKKFQSLEKLKGNGWIREETKAKVVKRKKKVPKTTKGSTARRRAARQRIKEAREAMNARLKSTDDDTADVEEVKGQGPEGALFNLEKGVAVKSEHEAPLGALPGTPDKKRKARFAEEVNPGEDVGVTPSGSHQRKRVMRKTPLPAFIPDPIIEEPYVDNEDVRASPVLNKDAKNGLEFSILESGEDPITCDMKGVKLDFDDVQSDVEDDLGFAAKYLASTVIDDVQKAEDKPKEGGIDLKYLMPSSPSIDGPLADVVNAPRALRSSRKSCVDPFSPATKRATSARKVAANPKCAVVDNLISFSPLPAK